MRMIRTRVTSVGWTETQRWNAHSSFLDLTYRLLVSTWSRSFWSWSGEDCFVRLSKLLNTSLFLAIAGATACLRLPFLGCLLSLHLCRGCRIRLPRKPSISKTSSKIWVSRLLTCLLRFKNLCLGLRIMCFRSNYHLEMLISIVILFVVGDVGEHHHW